jgi:hypothetical protein
MFDGARWIFSEEGLGVGAFRFAESTRGISPRLPETAYADNPIRFDTVDFLIACRMATSARIKNSELRTVLKQHNYDLSRATISRRIAALRQKGAFIPYWSFQGLGLNVMLAFAVESTDEVVETLYHMFPLFPDCFAFRTDKGVVFCVRTTVEMAGAIYYFMQTLRDEVDNLISLSRYENLGGRSIERLADYWNSEKQKWDFKRGFFDLTKKPLSF